jgi:glycosyltransferase involved in cell wall biosynthesis
MNAGKPRLALVSIGIRRDLIAPLVYFSRFERVHLYKKNVYGDLTAHDFDSSLAPYTSPFDLYKKLCDAHPAVIQGVEPFSYYTQPFIAAILLAARRTQASLIIPTFENRPLEIKFGRVRAAFLRRLVAIYFARACLVIPLNDGARTNVVQCHVAPHKIERALWGAWGVDLREFFPRSERSPQRSTNAPLILFVGRLHQEKGVFVLLDAFARVTREFPYARLKFVGDGPARAVLEKEIRVRGLQDIVDLTGTLKHRDLPEIFRAADIFCAPSLTTRKWAEQVGMSALQAMACGLPIVSTTSGAIPEFVPGGIAGILVPENNASALADALQELLAQPQRAREMGMRAYAYARAQYDAQANVEHAEQLVLKHCARDDARRL